MLVNSVTRHRRGVARLQRVVLVTGTKYYGSHLGPLQDAGARERSAPLPPDYYFDQIDWLDRLPARQGVGLGRAAAADAVRLCAGHADEHLPAIAVYAAISKELGLPLRFPGKPGAYTSIYQVTESTHFANAALWAATEPRCGQRGLQHHQRRLFPLAEPVAEVSPQVSTCRRASRRPSA